MLQFVKNVPDPNADIDYLKRAIIPAEGVGLLEAIVNHKRFCVKFTLGPPQAVEGISQMEWVNRGFIGLYTGKEISQSGRKILPL